MTNVREHVEIELSDGTLLSARMWLPDHSGPSPAILEFHPYPKRYVTAERDEIGHRHFATHGYTSIRVDMRGSGDSEGSLSDEYTDDARRDNVEVIEWIARQPWCTGQVGMYGLSWGGYNAIQMATTAPEPLKAIVVAGATDDRFHNDTHFLGGVMATEHVGWATTLLSFLTRPPDPSVVGDRWRELWLERLDELEWMLPKWLDHPWRDDYWTAGFPRDHSDGLGVPTLIAGGVADVYVNAILRMVTRQPGRVKGVIGPWGHHFPHRGMPGPSIDWLGQATRWFDRWLRGEENDVESEPDLRVFVGDGFRADGRSEAVRPGAWYASSAASVTTTPRLTLRLSSTGELLAGGVSEGRAPVSERSESEVVVATPPTLGTAAGEFMPMGWGEDLPADQRDDDEPSMVFDLPIEGEPMTILGTPLLRTKVRSSDPSGYVVARLCDVSPDGRSTRISLGAFELATHGGSRPPDPMSTDEWRECTIEFTGVAHRVAPGHRLRLALSSTYWPLFWPAAGRVELRIDTGASELAVPLATELDPYTGFGSGDGADPTNAIALTSPTFERELERHPGSSTVRYRIADRSPRTRFDHGLETENTTTRVYEIDEEDWSWARMTVRRDIDVQRGDWHVTTHLVADISSDAETFSTDVQVTATEGGTPIFERTYRSVTRR